MFTIDYESEAIQQRPLYPPRPVGVAVKHNDQPARYYGWGHPSGNNSTKAEAAEVLAKVYASGEEVLAHNHKFEMDLGETHFGLPRLPWNRVHDTMFLAFLADPHSSTISLKPLAERYLNQPPAERDEVYEWLRAHGVITAAQKSPGAFIAQCDGEVVGRYACGDVDRTYALFQLLHKKIVDAGMGAAYDRERRLLPILLDNERQGIRVDVPRLEIDVPLYERALTVTEAWLRKATKTPSLNLDADADVAEALQRCGAVTEWKLTPTGRKSTSKKNLIINHVPIATALNYRNRLQNLLSQSLRPWLEQAKANKDHIFTDWNQVRTARGSDVAGTRTGRLSCARFMNIAKTAGGVAVPTFIKAAEPLPAVRQYLLPDKGGVWGSRDFASQEFRILAHYENDGLLKTYQRNPKIDYHANMQRLIKEGAGLELNRHTVKTINFGLLYGMGVGRLAEALKIDVGTATKLRDAHRRVAPGIQALDGELKRRGRSGEPIRTWGGRIYHCEPPSDDRTYEYKLINYLVQGSAADATKEAIIRWSATKHAARLLVTVHDEIDISMPSDSVGWEMQLLNEAMSSVEFDVRMLSEGSIGPSWGELHDYDDSAEIDRSAAV